MAGEVGIIIPQKMFVELYKMVLYNTKQTTMPLDVDKLYEIQEQMEKKMDSIVKRAEYVKSLKKMIDND